MNDSVYNINETFIIEGVGDDTPIISACTALYSNEFFSCTGDTFIRLGTGAIYFNGDLYTNDNLSANTINASTYLSGGTNLFNIIQLTEITGGTYNSNSGVLSLKKGNNSSVNISGINNYYTTGATLVGNVAYFNRNDALSAYTLDLTTLIPPTSFDVFVTGGTYSNGVTTFRNNTGGTFTITGFTTPFSGGSVSGLTATTISATTYQNLPLDVYTTGVTLNNSNYELTMSRNDGQTFGVNLGILSSDVTITGGSYNINTGVVTFTNNTGGTFSVSGFSSGMTDTSITNFTYNNNNFVITDSTGGTFNASINSVTGLTSNGTISSNILSATTYQNLPLDVRVTGGTYSSGTAIFTNNTGGTFSVSGFSSSGTISGDYLPLSGGTVSGNTIFNSGLTVNYIDFDITPTIPNPTGGTLFFDSNENALSYKPITNQNDVTVNLGQESLIRVYNALPTTILNGQVLHITGATSGVPTVALANASKLGLTFTDSLAQSSGVATHDIPSGQYGFMTNFGVVRDLNTTAFTVGQEVFLSDTIDGALTNDPNNIAFTSRISTVGYCLESNATTGKILVVITNENPLQSLTQQEINVLLGNTISTGAYFYTGATTASTTTINVSPMRGWIVYNTGPTYATNPLVLNIYYSGGTNIAVTGLTSSDDTYLLVNSGGTLYQTNSFPSPIERRENIFLGRVVHPNKTTILNVEQSVDYDVSPLSSLRDLWVPIKIINEGVVPSPNGATLTFKTSSGTFWGNGIGFPTNELNPNAITVPAYLPASFYYTTQTGGTFTATTTTVDTLNYDVGGVKTNVPGSGSYTTQRIYMSQSGVIRLQYGQNYYSTLAKAIAAIPSETFVVNPDNSIDCTLIGLLTVKDGTGDLSNTDDAVFTFVSKFGEILGGTAGISTTTLQQAYDNSVNPEIVTNSTLNGVQFKGGTGNDTDKNIIIENNSGVETGFISADGSSKFNTVSATTISATTYQNLPLDIRVTGGTFNNNNGIATFTNNTGGTFTLNDFPTTGTTLLWTAGTNTYSVAQLGGDNIASGVYSLAVGSGTTASGDYSHSEGYLTTASGNYSHSEGENTTSNGPHAHAEGVGTLAAGDGSHAEGQNTIASGQASHAEGYYTLSNGFSTHSEGGFTTASGAYSHAEGNTTIASGDFSHAEGSGTIASGAYSHAEGQLTTASGDNSHAGGYNTNAYTTYSFATGVNSIASGSSITTSASPITISSAITITLSDPTYGRPAVILNGKVDAEWLGYYNDFCSLFTIYSGLSSQSIDCNSYTDIYEDSGLTYIVDSSIASTDYDMISGNTFENVNILVPEPAFAIGNGVKAFGASSFAEGYQTTASGEASHAEGSITTASGQFSHAEGIVTIAGGYVSHAEGSSTTASGNYSHAEGIATIAGGTYSHAEGVNTTASGQGSHAEGNNTIASGTSSHAEGSSTIAGGASSHAEGVATTAGGDYSHAEGAGTTAIGNTSHAEGYFTRAFGYISHAEGYFTRAYGQASHAEGQSTTALGNYSHAEGFATTAGGDTSHAEGFATRAIGDNSHAGGYNSIASGTSSFVHGESSVALQNATIVLGSFITGTSANTTYVDNLNIKSFPLTSAVRGLGIDINGFVVSASTSGGSTFTGGTVSGATQFTNGLSANTISATTYLNLPATAQSFISVSGNTILTNDNQTVIVDSVSAITITLPQITGDGRLITIKNINTGVETILPYSGQLIDGDTSVIVERKNVSLDFQSYNNNWYLI
jgi:hypothetical protein